MDLDNLPITERFVRASGPGGQNVNKVASAVELRLDVANAPLPDGVKLRLRVLAGRRLSADDILLIDSREYRTQAQNREAARARLSELLDLAHVVPKRRQKTKPSRSAKQARVAEKVIRGRIKEKRGRVRRGRNDD